MLGKVWIVIQARNLQSPELKKTIGERTIILIVALARKARDLYRMHTPNRVCGGVDWAEVYRLAETQVIRMKNASATVRQYATAQ